MGQQQQTTTHVQPITLHTLCACAQGNYMWWYMNKKFNGPGNISESVKTLKGVYVTSE